jgi:putative addiction module CopG family antidote
MANKTMNISLPAGMAQFIEQEVARGEYVSISDFIRSLVRSYQARNTEGPLPRTLQTDLATALEDVLTGRVVDGERVLSELKADLSARRAASRQE